LALVFRCTVDNCKSKQLLPLSTSQMWTREAKGPEHIIFADNFYGQPLANLNVMLFLLTKTKLNSLLMLRNTFQIP